MPAPKGNTYAKDAAEKKRKKKAAAEAKKQREIEKREKENKKMGAPKFEIDYPAVKQLASLMCTQEEIATFLGCSTKTLQRDEEFGRIYKDGMANGRMSLRRQQFKVALKGNVTMLIWLSKQFLGQSDKAEITTFDGDLMIDDKFDEAATAAFEATVNVDGLIDPESLIETD